MNISVLTDPIKAFSTELFNDIKEIKNDGIKESWNNNKTKVLSIAARITAVALIAFASLSLIGVISTMWNTGLIAKLAVGTFAIAIAHDMTLIHENLRDYPADVAKKNKITKFFDMLFTNKKFVTLESRYMTMSNTWILGQLPVLDNTNHSHTD